jgi:hypothetical protein
VPEGQRNDSSGEDEQGAPARPSRVQTPPPGLSSSLSEDTQAVMDDLSQRMGTMSPQATNTPRDPRPFTPIINASPARRTTATPPTTTPYLTSSERHFPNSRAAAARAPSLPTTPGGSLVDVLATLRSPFQASQQRASTVESDDPFEATVPNSPAIANSAPTVNNTMAAFVTSTSRTIPRVIRSDRGADSSIIIVDTPIVIEDISPPRQHRTRSEKVAMNNERKQGEIRQGLRKKQ